MPAVNPKILIWARETAGLSIEAAAKALGLADTKQKTGEEKLAAFENGEVEPNRQMLLKMSEKYRRALLVFYLNEPPKQGDRGQDFRTLPDTQSTADDALLDALIRDIKGRQFLVKSLLEDEEAELIPFVGSLKTEDGVETAVRNIQSVVNFNLTRFRACKTADEAFTYLRGRIESAGIFVLLVGDLGSHHTAIPVETFRGFAIADPIAPFVIINGNDAKSARSFTVLHEVTHLWLGTTGVSNTSIGSRIEQFCNDVAGELLLPAAELNELQAIQSLPVAEAAAEIASFAMARRISRSMVVYKLFRSGGINETKWHELDTRFIQEWRDSQKRDKEQASKGGPSYYVVHGHRLGTALLNLVNRSVNEGTLTPTKAGKVLGVKPRNVDVLLKKILHQGGQ